jgi:predicted AlkP superfamily phosphohydrolase/phosphomutase
MEIIKLNDYEYEVAKQTEDELVKIDGMQKALEERKSAIHEALKKNMELYGVQKITTDTMTITLVPHGQTSKLDTDKLKNKYEEVYIECTKLTTRKSYLKVNMK